MGEDSWDPTIPRSKGTVPFEKGALGEVILTDGPRVIICANCGMTITGPVFHLKPETYSVEYGGWVFYIERHIGVACGCAAKLGLMSGGF
jgi:hypothetical protein